MSTFNPFLSFMAINEFMTIFLIKMSNLLKVLITGTNKGIGYELVKTFLKYSQNAVIYATSR